MAPAYRFVRPEDPTDFEALLRADRRAFSAEPLRPDSPGTWARGELERARVVEEDGQVVGLGRLYSFELTVPGPETIPAAAVSWIGVLPTHRRRGLLRGLMETLHGDARDRGEPVAILTASEGGIYGRFGYGIGCYRVQAAIGRAYGHFSRPLDDDGRVTLRDRDDVLELCPPVYDRARRARPGMTSRPDYWWPDAVFDLLPSDQACFVAVHETRDGAIDGYVWYRVTGEWEGGISRRTLTVWDLVADAPRVRAALWRFVLDVDLMEEVRIRDVALDDPLRFLLADSRRLRVTALNDGLWVALLDPARALAARRYAVDGRLTIEVHGAAGGSCRLALDAGPEGASCVPTTAEPDLVLPVHALGSTYLGGFSFVQLHAAGLVEERAPGALARADVMFASRPAPALLSWF